MNGEEVTEAGGPPDSVTERSRLWMGGLGSPSPFTLRLMAECGMNAPGVLNGYRDLKKRWFNYL